MTIGGLWVPTGQKSDLTKKLRSVLKENQLGAELKWSKVSEKRLSAYKAVIDFFTTHDLSFRVIVVDKSQLDLDQFKDGDPELGFYTFYYELLVKWITKPVPYNLLLDFKKNKGQAHYHVPHSLA